MLLCSIALVVGAILLYLLVPEYQIYRVYPWPTYVLMLAALATAWRSRARRWLRLPILGISAAILLLFLWYTVSFSHLKPTALAVKPGDHFPAFTLGTSQGEQFSSAALKGDSAALYVFYRGDW